MNGTSLQCSSRTSTIYVLPPFSLPPFFPTTTHTHTGTHLFTEEDAETGRTIFHSPFHYESNFHNASYSLLYSVSRARRIAQEVTAISSSLPLSPSSSVFVRCDIERLDVMKVNSYPSFVPRLSRLAWE